MAVAFANISMAKIDMQILDKGTNEPHFNSLFLTNRYVVNRFIDQVNKHHPIIKFTAEISVSEATSFPLFLRVKDSTSSDF